MPVGEHDGFNGKAVLITQFNNATHRVHTWVHDKRTTVVLNDIRVRFVWTCTETQNLHDDYHIALLRIGDNKKFRIPRGMRDSRNGKSILTAEQPKPRRSLARQ